MFNFASKLINTLGDLVTVEEPPQPQPPSKSATTASTLSPFPNQRRASGGDVRAFQQPKLRFQGPASAPSFRSPNVNSADSHQSRATAAGQSHYRYPSPVTTMANGGQNNATNYQRQVTNMYSSSASKTSPYGSTTTNNADNVVNNSNSTTGIGNNTNYSMMTNQDFRDDRRETNALFETSDIDYQEDGYNVGGNFNNDGRQSYESDMRKDYGMYREHDNDDSKDYEEDDRYSLAYEDDNRQRSSSSYCESSPMQSTNECDDQGYTSLDQDYYDSKSNQQSSYHNSDIGYSNPADMYSSDQEKISDFVQFDKLADEWSMQAWKDDQQLQSYHLQSTAENNYGEIDEKPSLSPPEGDDNKNSSRSESESSDEISFGEALATGLIPPHMTPEIAARMNIEFMNHPKAVIESFYGHSPGEVYTIPEEDDEICSPTGADGVTSLRKQRMASACVEMSENIARNIANQRQATATSSTEQQMSMYDGTNSQQSNNPDSRLLSGNESKGMRQVQINNAMSITPQQMQSNQCVRFQSDQSNNNQRQSYRSPTPHQSQFNPPRKYQPESHQSQQPPVNAKNPNQQSIMPKQDSNQKSLYYIENQQPQMYSNDLRQQIYPSDDQSHPPTQSGFANIQQQQNYSATANVPQLPCQQSQTYQTNCSPPRLINPCDNSMQARASVNQQHQSAPRMMQPINPQQQQVQPAFYADNRQFIRGPTPNQHFFFGERQPQQRNTMENRLQQEQSLLTNYPNNIFPQPYYQNDGRSLLTDHMSQSCNVRQPQQAYQTHQYPTQVPLHQTYPTDSGINQSKLVDNLISMHQAGYITDRSQPQQGQYTIENRMEYYQDTGSDLQDNRLQLSHPPQPAQGYHQDNRQPYTDNQPPQGCKIYQQLENKRLNQQLPNNSNPESLERQRVSHSYQQDSLSIGSNTGESGHQARRQLPKRLDSLPSSQKRSLARRYPLQRFHSEERYNTYESDRGLPDLSLQNSEYQRTYERPRQRSSSLDSSEPNEPFHSGLRQRNDEYQRDNGGSGGDSRMQQKRGSQQMDRTRSRKSESRQSASLDEAWRTAQEIKSTLTSDTKKEEHYCAQHKRYTSTAENTSKSSRRVLPKEPLAQTSSRKIAKRQTKDKSTSTIKLEENAHQKGGILSNATRRVERGGNLKISFSEPISKVQKSGKIITAVPKTNNMTKTVITKSNMNKPVISSNVIVSHTSRNKATNTIEINPSSIGAVSPASRNLLLSSTVKDNRLLSSGNVRSLPVQITTNCNRTLDRYSSSETNLNMLSYSDYDQFLRPGSAPGLMYEPIQQPSNASLQLSLYEMHALKKEEKFWSDIYSALPADMKHLVANRGRGKISSSSFASTCSPTTGMCGHLGERPLLENRLIQRAIMSKGITKSSNRETTNSSLGERIGNRLRMLHEMKEQAGNISNRKKSANSLSRRSASDGEYSFSSATNFPMYWNLARRPHSDSAIDLLDHLDMQNSPMRVCSSAYNSSEYLPSEPGCFRVVDKSQSYLTSPSTNIPPSPAPTHPVRLKDTVLRAEHLGPSQFGRNYQHLTTDNRSGFFSCLQNIESLTRQYKEEDRIRTVELDRYEDEIYSDSGIPESDYGKYNLHPSRRKHVVMTRRHNDHF